MICAIEVVPCALFTTVPCFLAAQSSCKKKMLVTLLVNHVYYSSSAVCIEFRIQLLSFVGLSSCCWTPDFFIMLMWCLCTFLVPELTNECIIFLFLLTKTSVVSIHVPQLKTRKLLYFFLFIKITNHFEMKRHKLWITKKVCGFKEFKCSFFLQIFS